MNQNFLLFTHKDTFRLCCESAGTCKRIANNWKLFYLMVPTHYTTEFAANCNQAQQALSQIREKSFTVSFPGTNSTDIGKGPLVGQFVLPQARLRPENESLSLTSRLLRGWMPDSASYVSMDMAMNTFWKSKYLPNRRW